MKKIISLASCFALATTLALPISTTAEAGGKRECRAYAQQKADRKTSRRVVRNLVLGGIAGGVLGSVIGGRKTTVIGALGGATTGVLIGDSQWRKYYNRAYSFCRANL